MSDPLAELERLEALFERAVALSMEAREAFAERECADSPELRQRLMELLQADDEPTPLPSPAVAVRREVPGLLPAGTEVGRYRIVERLGEGGFGVVYRAEQKTPVVREVALKVIKLGMDTAEVVTRFEAERQALALMDHPAIARVLDGGATEEGRPFFVMELVDGLPLTEYCDRHLLSLADRLELFEQVCLGVQHAHQKGIIHRDLKPSNVLVREQDGIPRPMIIDFGIAKALHTELRLTEVTIHTEQQRLLGTPAYMSPEQARLPAVDVDTRSDIYALGVLLHELLAGRPPFTSDELLAEGLTGMERILREREPKPASEGAGEAAAETRGLSREELRRTVRGDLDSIVAMALAKERQHRYASAGDLAADLRRHRADEPVLARPLSAGYRLRKLVSRHRSVVLTVCVVLFTLLAGITGTGLGFLEASRQRDAAQLQAQNAEAVTDFLVEALSLTDPEVAGRPDLGVRDLLDRASTQVEGAFEGQPRAEARLRGAIGRAYTSLAEEELAERHLRRGLELLESAPPVDGGQHYDLLWALTQVLFRLERLDAYATAQRAREVGLEHLATTHPSLAGRLGELYATAADVARAGDSSGVPLLEERFATAREALPELPPGDDRWPMVADTFQAAGLLLWYGPNELAAEPLWTTALEIRRRERGPNDPDVGEILTYLVELLNRAGRFEEAEERLRGAIDVLVTYGEEGNFYLAQARSLLGESLAGQGRFEEAEPLLLSAHRTIAEGMGFEDSFFVAMSVGRLVQLYRSWGRGLEEKQRSEELALLQMAYPVPWSLSRLALGPERREIEQTMDQLSTPAVDVAVLDRLLTLRRSSLPPDDPAALVISRQLLALAALESTSPEARRAMVDGALEVLGAWGDTLPFEVVDALAQRCAPPSPKEEGDLTAIRRLLPDLEGLDRWEMALVKVRAAECLINNGGAEEAVEILRPAHAALVRQVGAEHQDAQWAVEVLNRALEKVGSG